MNTLYLTDGTTVEIPESRFTKFVTMLTHRGIKSVRFDNTIIVVSPSNIIRIELGDEDESENKETTENDREVATSGVEETTESGQDTEGDGSKEPEPTESGQQRKDRILAEMVEKSNCAGNKHVGKEQIIHFSDVEMRKKGSTHKVISRRYFPVCSFCGLKQRYIKADSLTDEQKENAILWVAKD